MPTPIENNTLSLTELLSLAENLPDEKPEQIKTLTLGTAAPTDVVPDSGKVLSQVSVIIDTNAIKAEYIAKDKVILGITGTHKGGEEADMYAGADEPTGAVNGDLWVDTSDEAIDVEPLSITQNGTYTAPTKKAYSPVTANIPSKNVQAYTTPVSTTSTTMADTNMKITVSKTGTYNIYLTAGCNRNTGTYNYRLRKGSTNLVASTAISTTTGVCKVLTNQSLNSGDVLTVGLKSASTSYYAYATSLIIIEQ